MKEYKVVWLEEFNIDEYSYKNFCTRTENEMNEMAKKGWRVVCVTNTLFSDILKHSVVFERDI